MTGKRARHNNRKRRSVMTAKKDILDFHAEIQDVFSGIRNADYQTKSKRMSRGMLWALTLAMSAARASGITAFFAAYSFANS